MCDSSCNLKKEVTNTNNLWLWITWWGISNPFAFFFFPPGSNMSGHFSVKLEGRRQGSPLADEELSAQRHYPAFPCVTCLCCGPEVEMQYWKRREWKPNHVQSSLDCGCTLALLELCSSDSRLGLSTMVMGIGKAWRTWSSAACCFGLFVCLLLWHFPLKTSSKPLIAMRLRGFHWGIIWMPWVYSDVAVA